MFVDKFLGYNAVNTTYQHIHRYYYDILLSINI